MSYTFRPPGSPEDWQAIRRLNHRIFAEEVAQHDATPEGLLVDPLESRSRFVIALHSAECVGMVCAHDDGPYSVESKLDDPSVLETLERPLIEVRLLAIDPGHRNGMVLAGLLGGLLESALETGQGTLLISGIAQREAMYRRMGFIPIGPQVRRGHAHFLPMALSLSTLPPRVLANLRRWQLRSR